MTISWSSMTTCGHHTIITSSKHQTDHESIITFINFAQVKLDSTTSASSSPQMISKWWSVIPPQKGHLGRLLAGSCDEVTERTTFGHLVTGQARHGETRNWKTSNSILKYQRVFDARIWMWNLKPMFQRYSWNDGKNMWYTIETLIFSSGCFMLFPDSMNFRQNNAQTIANMHLWRPMPSLST